MDIARTAIRERIRSALACAPVTVINRPDLFPVLRVLADRRGSEARCLILGSASGELLRQNAKTLAGRMERIEIGGFALAELGANAVDTLWRRGGFTRPYLARSERDSVFWCEQFIQILPERDFPQRGLRVPAVASLLFCPWNNLTGAHGFHETYEPPRLA